MEFKRGDTMEFRGVVTYLGAPFAGQTANIRASLRTLADALLANFTITETLTPGTYLFSIPHTTTAGFPVGVAEMDVECTVGGKRSSSVTMRINIIKDVTRDGV